MLAITWFSMLLLSFVIAAMIIILELACTFWCLSGSSSSGLNGQDAVCFYNSCRQMNPRQILHGRKSSALQVCPDEGRRTTISSPSPVSSTVMLWWWLPRSLNLSKLVFLSASLPLGWSGLEGESNSHFFLACMLPVIVPGCFLAQFATVKACLLLTIIANFIRTFFFGTIYSNWYKNMN